MSKDDAMNSYNTTDNDSTTKNTTLLKNSSHIGFASEQISFVEEDENTAESPRRAPLFSELNEDECRELWAALALRHTEGLGPRSHGKLVQHFGSAYNAVQAAPHWDELEIPKAKAQLVWNGAWRESAHEEWKAITKSDCGILLWTSPQYPVLLRHIYDPPVLLYCKGDTSLLSNATISIVGSRLCSQEGQKVAKNIAEELGRVGITVVSGMAKGVDAIAHHAALQGVGRSIGVLGTGIDICYPYENKKLYEEIQSQGLLITEFSLGMRAMPQNFPARNRIVSGLSLGVLVVEAAARSGSLITARLALEQNREVYAVPGPITMQQYSGCHELIRQGAHPVFHVDDILRDLASPLQHQLENAPCLNLMRRRRRKKKNQDHDEQKYVESKHVVQNMESEVIPVRVILPSDETVPMATQAPRDLHLPQDGEALQAIEKTHKSDSSQAPVPTESRPTADVKPMPTPENKTETPHMSLDEPTVAIVKILENGAEIHIDTIAQSLNMDASMVSTMLLVLEVSGKVRRLSGMRYMLVKGA